MYSSALIRKVHGLITKNTGLVKAGSHIIKHPVANHLHLPILLEEIYCVDCRNSDVGMVRTQQCGSPYLLELEQL